MLAASGCSEKIANAILDEKRRNGDFKDREDFKKRCKMDRTLSDYFVYNNSV